MSDQALTSTLFLLVVAITKVDRNCSRPKTSATLMWPMIFVLMKPCAQFDITT